MEEAVGGTEGLSGFPAELFSDRRRRALAALGEGAMVLPAAPVLRRDGGAELRYRPDSNLFYLTGFPEPETVLVLRGFAQEERSVLFVRPRDEAEERWSGARAGPDGARSLVAVDEVRSVDQLHQALPSLLEGADRLYFRLGEDRKIERKVVEALRISRTKGAREGKGPRGVVDPGEILNELRLRKDSMELAAVREAVEITIAGFRAGLARVAPGTGEWEVEAAMEAEFRRRGAFGPAFTTIVGSGPNACVLHYVENGRQMARGELLLVDAGAERRMYSADVTRTVPVSGSFNPEQRDIYQLVDAARREVLAAIEPGVPVGDLHRRAARILSTGLRDLGVLAGEVEALLEEKAYKAYYPHSTSHWLGLDTHDVGDYARDGSALPLEPGMLLTVEPGLYFPPDGDGPFAGIGVRIEDDVLVTETGADILTSGLPTGADEVEALIRASAAP